MNQIKHLFVAHLWPWLSAVVRDAKAWASLILTTCFTTASQWLAGLDIAAVQAWTKRETALRVLITFGPGILTALATGRPHQSADDIGKKLASLPPEKLAELGLDVKAVSEPPKAP